MLQHFYPQDKHTTSLECVLYSVVIADHDHESTDEEDLPLSSLLATL